MNLLSRFRSWLKNIVNGQRLEREMETELRFHLESRAADLVRNGLSPQAAMRQARIEFGGIESHSTLKSYLSSGKSSAMATSLRRGRQSLTQRFQGQGRRGEVRAGSHRGWSTSHSAAGRRRTGQYFEIFRDRMAHNSAVWMFAIEHSAEHYGRMVVYYRANNLVPPALRARPRTDEKPPVRRSGNRAANLREDVAGIEADELHCAHGDHQDHRKHDRILCDILPPFLGPQFAPNS
jgi:hypothetical protein